MQDNGSEMEVHLHSLSFTPLLLLWKLEPSSQLVVYIVQDRRSLVWHKKLSLASHPIGVKSKKCKEYKEGWTGSGNWQKIKPFLREAVFSE